jgi:hypothetical protein
MGSVSVAGWIAHGVFAVLLLRAWVELRPRTAIVFALLWLAGYFGLPFILYAEPFFMPFVALLDIVLLLRLMAQKQGDGLQLH